jgi:hypothetical protein
LKLILDAAWQGEELEEGTQATHLFHDKPTESRRGQTVQDKARRGKLKAKQGELSQGKCIAKQAGNGHGHTV